MTFTVEPKKAAIGVGVVVLAFLFGLGFGQGRVPFTATPTPYPAPLGTPTTFPASVSSFGQPILCTDAGIDCVQARGGYSIHVYDATGNNTFGLDGTNGNLTISGALSANSITAPTTPQAVLQYTAGSKEVCNTQNITGTLAVNHGLATPAVVLANINADPVGNYNFVTDTNASATVTIKVWGLVAQTPVAATTPVSVNWCVIGTP